MNLIREDEGKTFTFQHFGENRLEGEAVSFIVIHNLDFRNLHFKMSEKMCRASSGTNFRTISKVHLTT